jgi:hypothetical protein
LKTHPLRRRLTQTALLVGRVARRTSGCSVWRPARRLREARSPHAPGEGFAGAVVHGMAAMTDIERVLAQVVQ